MSHPFDTQFATGDPRLTVADAYLFDATPDRTVMVMICRADAAPSAPATFHSAALYEFRFDTTGTGREDTSFQLRFSEPIWRAEQGLRQEFTVHYVTGVDVDVDPIQHIAGKQLFSAELNNPSRVGAIDGFAGLVGDMWAADAFAVSTMLKAFYLDRRYTDAASAHRRNVFARRNAMAIVLEVPNALIGDGQVTMWSSISLYGHSTKVQISRFGIPFSRTSSCRRGDNPSSSATTKWVPSTTSNCSPSPFATSSPNSPRSQDWDALVSHTQPGLPRN
jgi:hypothetical protein